MAIKKTIHKILIACIAMVWIANGLFCKVLNLVPRHQLIVARILGNEHALLFTKAIGTAEILMAIWVLSGIKSRWCTLAQITVVVVMNIIEFILAPDLLLFGKINSVVALLFIVVLYYNEFVLNKKLIHQTQNALIS